MPRIRLTETIPYTPDQVYGLIVDVESYPQFLPWCVSTRKFDVEEEQFIAELTIAFKGIRQSFQTIDRVIPGKQVDIHLKSGPFRHLTSHWRLTPQSNDSTRIDFSIDFQFKSRIMNMTVGPVFTHAAKQMVAAFRSRAQALYGSDAAS
ncbi:MAG: type II toxin-antitoxin system RatA family toxin [Magnetococcales bacterium]|nr:type II toxin-antitoxin system RatA family toxin [Magnetococcales bacterium]